MTLTHIQAEIVRQYEVKTVKMDWLKMEDLIRCTLSLVAQNAIEDRIALETIDAIVGAFTRRGEVL